MFHPEYLNYGALAFLAIAGVAVSPLRNRFRARETHRQWVRPERVAPRVRTHTRPRYEPEFDPVEQEPEVHMQPPQPPPQPPRHEPPKPHEPPKKEEPKKDDPQKGKQGPEGEPPQPRQPAPRLSPDYRFTLNTTNYSVAPGMAWFEWVTPQSISTWSTTPTIGLTLSPRGSASMLRAGLMLPVAVAVIRPTPTGGMFKRLDQQMPQAIPQEMYPYYSQNTEINSPLWNSYSPAPAWTNIQQMLMRLWMPGDLIASTVWANPQNSGMSSQGFPGQPLQLMPSGPDPVLPYGLGINSAFVDTTVTPYQLFMQFMGSSSGLTIDAGVRFLFIAITGV